VGERGRTAPGRWHSPGLMGPSRWVVERQDCKDADWTDRLHTRLATPTYSPTLLIDPLWTTYTCTPPRGQPPSLTPPVSQSASRRECGEGGQGQHVVNSIWSDVFSVTRQSQRYWMSLASVVNIICCMQARSRLVMFLQCFDAVGWVIWPEKKSPIWPIMCLVGR